MGMTLAKLKKIVDFSVKHERNPEEVEVVINVKLPYVTCGSRPGVSIKHAGMGFDWEAGQFRIEPENKLIEVRYNGPQMISEPYEKRYHCPKCGHLIAIGRKETDIRFCSSCGQEVKWYA